METVDRVTTARRRVEPVGVANRYDIRLHRRHHETIAALASLRLAEVRHNRHGPAVVCIKIVSAVGRAAVVGTCVAEPEGVTDLVDVGLKRIAVQGSNAIVPVGTYIDRRRISAARGVGGAEHVIVYRHQRSAGRAHEGDVGDVRPLSQRHGSQVRGASRQAFDIISDVVGGGRERVMRSHPILDVGRDLIDRPCRLRRRARIQGQLILTGCRAIGTCIDIVGAGAICSELDRRVKCAA